MDTKSKIKQLWQYLKVQDDEVLIIQSYNCTQKFDEFLVAKMIGNELDITTENKLPEFQADKPFRFIQQFDSSGRHVIPSVKQLKQDEQIDY